MADFVFDVCVVGAGLWGSAAAYHLSLNTSYKVCLIGPDEPTDFTDKSIFGAYYDESCIVRHNVGNVVDAELAKRSTEGFKVLEKITGISLFTECSHINLAPSESQYIVESKRTSSIFGLNHLSLTNHQLTQRFPYLTIGDGNECVLQLSKSGMVNPRKQVLAQKTAALLHGCTVIADIVDHINKKHQPGKSRIFELVTEGGHIVHSRKVLLCTGGFTHFKNLLPMHLLPDIRLAPTQTLRIELSRDDVHMLRDMSTVSSMTREDDKADCYICPPLHYPDGKIYLKIGHGRLRYIESQEEVVNWYRGDGDPHVTETLLKMITTYFPGLKPVSTRIDTCVVAATRSGLPYVDMITPEIGIAVGGNGVGGRLSYEVGRMAANMMKKGNWDHDLSADHFKVQFKNKTSKL